MKRATEDEVDDSHKRLRSRYEFLDTVTRYQANDHSCGYDYNDVISVLVGGNEQSFTVHKDLICARSKFFVAACSERWIEGQSKVVRLPESSPKIFQIYMAWLFAGNAAVEEVGHNATESKHSDVVEQRTLVKLYLLAQYLNDIKLRNQCLKVLVSRTPAWKTLLWPSDYKLIWDSTMPGCLLRTMIIDEFIARSTRDGLAERITQYPTSLLQELAVALMQRAPTEDSQVFSLTSAKYMEAEESTE